MYRAVHRLFLPVSLQKKKSPSFLFARQGGASTRRISGGTGSCVSSVSLAGVEHAARDVASGHAPPMIALQRSPRSLRAQLAHQTPPLFQRSGHPGRDAWVAEICLIQIEGAH